MTPILAVTSCVVMVSAFVLYHWQVFSGKSVPNATTWFLWATLGALSASSYFVMSGDLEKSAAALTDVTLCGTVFIFAAWNKKFAKLVIFDYVIIFGAAGGGSFWLVSGDTDSAHIFLQIVAIISFLPTINGLLRGYTREAPYPWLLWAAAYTLSATIAILNYDGNWHTLIMPVVMGVGMHALVGSLAILKNNKKTA